MPCLSHLRNFFFGIFWHYNLQPFNQVWFSRRQDWNSRREALPIRVVCGLQKFAATISQQNLHVGATIRRLGSLLATFFDIFTGSHWGFRGKSTRSLVFTMKYIEVRHVPIFSFNISLQLGPCLKGCGVTWADLFLLFQVTYWHHGNMQSRIQHMRCTTPITCKLLDKFTFIFIYLCNILTLGLPHERRVITYWPGWSGCTSTLEIPRK